VLGRRRGRRELRPVDRRQAREERRARGRVELLDAGEEVLLPRRGGRVGDGLLDGGIVPRPRGGSFLDDS
jgi:hypothetical protein